MFFLFVVVSVPDPLGYLFDTSLYIGRDQAQPQRNPVPEQGEEVDINDAKFSESTIERYFERTEKNGSE